MPRFFKTFGSKQVTVIRHEGRMQKSGLNSKHTSSRQKPSSRFMPGSTRATSSKSPIRAATPRVRIVQRVDVLDHGPREMQHIEVVLGAAGPPRAAPIRRLELQNLHPQVVVAASDLFMDGHYSQAVFEACKTLEIRVREQSGMDLSGRQLMTQAFSGDPPPIPLADGSSQNARDEQEGLRFVFMGVTQGIRNPKGHGMVEQPDPQRALEYLGLISILFRRLDDVAEERD